MSKTTEHTITVGLSNDDFHAVVADGMDRVVNKPYNHHLVVDAVKANSGNDGWAVEVIAIPDEDES